MRVLGVDASLTSTGFAVLDIPQGGGPRSERVLATGRKRTQPKDGTHIARVRDIAAATVALAQHCGAELVGLEVPYVDVNRSIKVALDLRALGQQIHGDLAEAGFEVVTVAASSRAKALGVSGRAKREVAKPLVLAAVLTRYGLDIPEDEADAIGVALAAATKRAREQRAAQMPEQLKLAMKQGRRQKRRANA